MSEEFVVNKEMNATIADIFKRYSCRKYEDKPVPVDLIRTIVECGRVAPCGGNNQSTTFYVITNPEVLKGIIQIAEKEFAKMDVEENMYGGLKNSINFSKRGGYDFTYHAPVLIVMTNKKTYGNAMADSVCALMNIATAATSLGLGSCYLNQLHWLDDSQLVRDFLKVSDEDTICCSIGIGYPAIARVKEREITGNPVIELF